MTSMIVEKEITEEESILNEFTRTLKALQKKYTSSVMIEEELKKKGAIYLNNGGYKVFFEYKDYAIAIIRNKNRFEEKLLHLIELDINRKIFNYPLHFSTNVKFITCIQQLCQGDLYDLMFGNDIKDKTKTTKVISYVKHLFRKNLSSDFVQNVLSTFEQCHQLDSTDKGIYNFDVKFENLLIDGEDNFKICDIDGFGVQNYFGHHTDTWCISLYGASGALPEHKHILNKHFGILNDLYGLLMVIIYGRVLIENYQQFVDMFSELQIRTTGSSNGHYVDVASGKHCQSLKHQIYKGDCSKYKNFNLNCRYAKCKMILIRKIIHKYMNDYPKYRNALDDLSAQMREFEKMDLMDKRKFNTTYVLFTAKLCALNSISVQKLRIKLPKRSRTS